MHQAPVDGACPAPRRIIGALVTAALVAAALIGAGPGTAAAQDAGTDEVTYGDRAGLAMGGRWTWRDEAEQARGLDGIANSGATWVRVSFPWSSMERQPGNHDWSVHDRIVRLAKERDLRVIANVSYTPPWARPLLCLHHHHCAPRDPGPYADFVSAVIDRYAEHGVEVVEVWNEPNIQNFWRPSPDPQAYGELLRHAYDAAKETDPDVTVISGGLAPAPEDDDADRINPQTFLEGLYASEGADAFDGVGMHPYSYPRAPTDPHPTNTFTNLPEIRELMVAEGDADAKVWLTEFGYWTSPVARTGRGTAVTEEQQARYLKEAYDAVADVDWVGPMLWYSLQDRVDRYEGVLYKEARFGLLRGDGSLKPAAHTMWNLMDEPLPASAAWMAHDD